MTHTGICPNPNCKKKKITNVKVQNIDMKHDNGVKWKGYSYQCPSCGWILGVQMNPIELNKKLKKDIIKELS